MNQTDKGHSILLANIGSEGTASLLSTYNDIEMFLAPLVINNHAYEIHCRNRVNETFTILDSGSFELFLGTSYQEFGAQDFLELAMNLGVDEVVSLDKPDDPQYSFYRTTEFIDAWQKLPVTERPCLMVVPHGKTISQWFLNAEKLLSKVGTCTVGIPRIFAQRCNQGDSSFRVKVGEQIIKSYPFVSVHILGAGPDFLSELYWLKGRTSIRSIDSTFVHRYSSVPTDPFEMYVEPLPLSDGSVPRGYEEQAYFLNKRIHSILRETASHG